jgi:PIN domain
VVETELVEADVHNRVSAFLDANTLHPMVVCDLLIRLALDELFRPAWSARVLDEVRRSVLRRRPDITEERMTRRLQLMNEALPGAEVRGYEHLLPATAVFGSDDHVVAAAMYAEVEVIVTDNVRDFPAGELAVRGLRAQTVDEFLQDLWLVDSASVSHVIAEQAEGTRNPALTVSDVLSRLSSIAPRFVGLAKAIAPTGDPHKDSGGQ